MSEALAWVKQHNRRAEALGGIPAVAGHLNLRLRYRVMRWL
jgi:hypothetical protein